MSGFSGRGTPRGRGHGGGRGNSQGTPQGRGLGGGRGNSQEAHQARPPPPPPLPPAVPVPPTFHLIDLKFEVSGQVITALLAPNSELTINPNATKKPPPEDKVREQGKKEQKENRKNWTLAAAKIVDLQKQAPSSSPRKNVNANFFSVSFLDPTPDIRKYRIELPSIPPGDEKGRAPSSKNARRGLIMRMLNEKPPPHTSYATDYFDTIVSKGKLFSDMSEKVGTRFLVSHTRAMRQGDSTSNVVTTVLVYEGILNITELGKLAELGHPLP